MLAGPLVAYGAWARRHHLTHHFAGVNTNHGVTSPLWDLVFGTWVASDVVSVPARHASKLPWLVDDGAVRLAYASQYQVA